MANTDAAANVPLLPDANMGASEILPASHLNSTNNSEHEVEFYDPSAILDISREVALGYLILLTGGGLEYEPPTTPQDDSQEPTSSTQRNELTTNLDEESASLAYAAIVDGNVLHACFGLKATANGNSSIPTIGAKNEQPSLLCCFPASSATMQLVLPHAAKNKMKMQNLMEILREVRDLHYEASESAESSSKISVYMRVIQAYTQCFTYIVKYHDAMNSMTKSTSAKKRGGRTIGCFSDLLNKLKMLSKPKNNSQLEKLQNDTLGDIEHGFQGLKQGIWESLESMAAETALTGTTMEGSPARVRGKR